MDNASFDRLTRLLAGNLSRRAGLAAALAALTAAAPEAADPASARTPGREGACDRGGRNRNVCKKDSQCCTGICDLGLGKKNKDRKGRCRCRSNGQQCTEDRNCCGTKMVCIGGICGDPCVALGSTCSGSGACCAGTCGGSPQPGLQGSNRGAPVCCLDDGQSGCTEDTDCCAVGNSTCVGGVCTASCKALGDACFDGDFCCAGSCDFKTTPSLERERGGSSGSTRVCCIPNGQTGCQSSSDCCNGNAQCNGGTCQLP